MSSANAENSAKSSVKRRGNPDKIKPHQFKPGQSGNPGGRPAKKPLTEMYERLLQEPEFLCLVESSIRSMVKSGRMVSQLQLKEMAERVEGKVEQAVKVDGAVKLSIAEVVRKVRERKLAYERSNQSAG